MKWSVMVIAASMLLAWGVLPGALAQDTTAKDATSKAPNKESIQKMPTEAKLQNAASMVSDMKRELQGVSALLEQAEKKERNISKINCVNSKLLSIKGFVKVSEQSYLQLKDAASSKDNETVNHNYLLIALGNDKVSRLSEEARLCVGEVAEINEEGESTYTMSPDIAAVEPITTDGQLFEGETFAEVLSPERIPELTPFQ